MKNKIFFLSLIFLLSIETIKAQVGIGTTNPDPSALLDITSSNKGLLIPRMTTAQRIAIAAPVAGLQVFDTTTGSNWFHNGTEWTQNASFKNTWNLDGNTNGAVKKFGSTDAFDLPFITNNTERMRILSNGLIGIGTNTPRESLDIKKGFNFHTGGFLGIGFNSFYDTTISSWKHAGYDGGSKFASIINYDTSGNLVFSSSTIADVENSVGSFIRTFSILPNGNVGIGPIIPSARLEVAGQVKITGGTPGSGKVLTSIATGLATWTTPSTGTITNVTGTLPISSTGGSTPVISIANANTTTTGALTGANFTTFSNKIGTASNGLTATSGDVKLGGTLIQNTSITQAGFNFGFTGGNLGVGTTTPGTTLDVNGTTRATTFTFPAPTGDPAPLITSRTVPVGQGSSNQKTELILFHSNDGDLGTAGRDQITLRAPALSFQTYFDANVADINNNLGYNERMFIDPIGNVGIGTSLPTAKLEVAGQVKITGGVPGAGKVLTSDAAGLATWATPSTGGLTAVTGSLPISSTGGSTPVISIATANTTTTGALTGADFTTFNNKIGTASNGLTATAGDVKLGGPLTGLTTITALTATNKLSIVGSGVDAFNIDGTTFSVDATNGRIGIGIAAPTTALDIVGQIKISGGTPAIGQVLTSNATGLATWEPPTLQDLRPIGVLTEINHITYDAGFGSTGTSVGSGIENIGIGNGVFNAITSASFNVGLGNNSLNSVTDGNYNIAIGRSALLSNTSGFSNIGIGDVSLRDVTTGYQNTGIGDLVLATLTDGTFNTAIGAQSGIGLTTGDNNTFLGAQITVAPNTNRNIILADGLGTQRINVIANGNVGINEVAPKSRFEVDGSEASKLLSTAAAVTLGEQRYVIVTAAVLITLPGAATCTGRVYTINARVAGVTVSGFRNLTNTLTTTIANGTSIEIISDGTNWQQVR